MSKISREWIETKTFPNIESETDSSTRRRWTSFGEAVSSFAGSKLTPSRTTEYFRCFYIGFSEETTSWYPYQREDPLFENPDCFDSDTNSFEDRVMDILIKLGILPANFFSGKDSPTYEFYNPSVAARQFSLGQMPIGISGKILRVGFMRV